MDSIPIALRPLVKRLESLEDVSQEDLVSILFVVRLGDLLHRGFYATFLTRSLTDQLCEKLAIPDLVLEIEVFAMRWSYRQGAVSVVHDISFDHDMFSAATLSKIGWSVLDGNLAPKEGLQLLRDHQVELQSMHGWEASYRNFPGRALVLPLMGSTCATVYFGGTWLDLGFAACCGMAGGLVAWAGSCHKTLAGIADYIAAIFVAMISVGSLLAFPESTCFSAQVMGSLYWFLYGTAYVLSLYEITNNQLVTGLTRLASALLRTYGLAIGVALGVWFSAFGVDRWDAITDTCDTKQGQITNPWMALLFPLSAIACLMQFRVKLSHFFICLVVQAVAYGFQYLIGDVWNQPEFLSNLVPAFLTVLASNVCIVIAHYFRISSLQVRIDETISKRKKFDQDNDDTNGHAENGDYDSFRVTFVDTGWTEKGAGGYNRADKLAYTQSDVWFCLLPALYLLVPGSKLLQSAFLELLSELDDTAPWGVSSLSTSLMSIALGQVVGLRLGFASVWVYEMAWTRLTNKSKTPSPTHNSCTVE